MLLQDFNQTSCSFCCCSPAHRILTVIFMILLTLAILFGNVVTLAVLLSRKRFHTPQGYLKISLAVADLALGILVVPFSVYVEISLLSSSDSSSQDRFLAASSGQPCSVVGLVFAGCTLVSISTLFLLTLERSVAILKPLHKEAVVTRSRTLHLILLSWLCSFFLALSPMLFSGGGLVMEYNSCSRLCTYAPAPASPPHLWHLLLLFPAFDFSLLGATLVINALSFTIIRQYSRRRKRLAGREREPLKLAFSDIKAAKTIGTLTVAFTASFTPIAVFVAGNVVGYQWCTFSFFAFWILTSNSCWNVVIYCVLDQRFRQGALRLLPPLPARSPGLQFRLC
ncbi:adenosine receptor A3 [Microcaecilia unicolor]|uniref:Adenosine receptor A3-like n=1 Tax=Microcaecilia unicolor TaxID=1415580 RepID=A0A6P7ZBD3_9AMPH|nr:adenosine receptor A3-like [Microcaecilia unicolor]